MLFKSSDISHWVNDDPSWAGTAEEVALYRQRQMRLRVETRPQETHVYALTEILTIEFKEGNEISDIAKETAPTLGGPTPLPAGSRSLFGGRPVHDKSEPPHTYSTEDGEAFAAFTRTILNQGGLTNLLWGKVFDSKAKILLLLDWETTKASIVMHETSAFQKAAFRLQQTLKAPIRAQRCDFWDENSRDSCFDPLSPHWTAFYMWHFLTQICDYELPFATSTSDKLMMVSRSWEMHWTHYCHKMFQRLRGHVGWTGSWLDTTDDGDQDTFCGVVAMTTRQMLENELAIAENLPYEEGGLEDLKAFATSGLDVFHVRFIRADQHSIGSHDPPTVYDFTGMYPQ